MEELLLFPPKYKTEKLDADVTRQNNNKKRYFPVAVYSVITQLFLRVFKESCVPSVQILLAIYRQGSVLYSKKYEFYKISTDKSTKRRGVRHTANDGMAKQK